MARQSLCKCFYVSALSFLFQPRAQCPSRSPLGWILTLRHSIKEQINLRGICMTGWKDCMYFTEPGRDSWFPSLCISFSSGFQVGVEQKCTTAFIFIPTPQLVLMEQGHSTHHQHWEQGSSRKTALEKQTVSQNKAHKLIIFPQPDSVHHTHWFNCASLAGAGVSSPRFHFVCAHWLCSLDTSPSVHSFSLQQHFYRIQNFLPSKFCTGVVL